MHISSARADLRRLLASLNSLDRFLAFSDVPAADMTVAAHPLDSVSSRSVSSDTVALADRASLSPSCFPATLVSDFATTGCVDDSSSDLLPHPTSCASLVPLSSIPNPEGSFEGAQSLFAYLPFFFLFTNTV